MRYGTYFPAAVASGATLSSEVKLEHAWENVYLEVPTMTSNSQLHIQAARASGGSYRRIYHPTINSSTVGTNVFAIVSAMTNAIVPIPNGHKFIKIETTATIDNGVTFNIVCGD